MKKALAFLLSIVIAASMLVMTANAATEPKIDSRLSEMISKADNLSGGIVIITHHNPQYPTEGVTDDQKIANNLLATSLLCEQIEKTTYAEILWFDINKLYVGLPYSAVEKVAALDTVDSISDYDERSISTIIPKDKISEELTALIDSSNLDNAVNLVVSLSYNPAIYYGFSKDDYDDPQDYIVARRNVNADYYSTINTEYYELIASKANIELNSVSKYTPAIYITTTVSEIKVLSELTEIDGLDLIPSEPSDQLTEPRETETVQSPTEMYFDNPADQSTEPREAETVVSTEFGFDNPIDKPAVVPGDADGDGEVTVLDATVIQRTLASIPVSFIDKAAADADGDGEVTILDATGIQRTLAGLD